MCFFHAANWTKLFRPPPKTKLLPRSGEGKYNHPGQQPLVWRSRIRPSHLSSPDVCPHYNPSVLTCLTEHQVEMDGSECGFWVSPVSMTIKPFRCSIMDGVMLRAFLLLGFWANSPFPFSGWMCYLMEPPSRHSGICFQLLHNNICIPPDLSAHSVSVQS